MYSDNWERLNENNIRNLQFLGGTFLGSSRGGFDAQKMIDGLQRRGINQVYIIGGDGTQRGVHMLHQ
jgi:6-phosphofructokinase 1